MVLVTFDHASHGNQEIGHLIREPNFGKVTIVTWGGQVKVLMFILCSKDNFKTLMFILCSKDNFKTQRGLPKQACNKF